MDVDACNILDTVDLIGREVWSRNMETTGPSRIIYIYNGVRYEWF